MNDTQGPDIEDFFAAARDRPVTPSPELMARIAADADRLAPTARMVARPQNGIADALRRLGGWPVLAGLVTATVAGIWIGYATPSLVMLGGAGGDGTYDLGGLLPGYGVSEDWSG